MTIRFFLSRTVNGTLTKSTGTRIVLLIPDCGPVCEPGTDCGFGCPFAGVAFVLSAGFEAVDDFEVSAAPG
jgi:hypothetical protein